MKSIYLKLYLAYQNNDDGFIYLDVFKNQRSVKKKCIYNIHTYTYTYMSDQEAVPAPTQEAVPAPVPAEEAVPAPVPAEEAVPTSAEEAVPAPAEEAVPAPAEEAVPAPAVPEPQPEPLYPTTHEEVERLYLFFVIKQLVSERLIHYAIHSLLDVVPDGNGWEWAANIDVNNINEGSDPIFDALNQKIIRYTESLLNTIPDGIAWKRVETVDEGRETNYDFTWETNKNMFLWIIRQLNYIAKY